MSTQLPEKKRQCVWIIRYGKTEFPLVEGKGPFDSDIDPTEGIEHAKRIAQRIAGSGRDAPSLVYASPFQRTAHTAHVLAQEVSTKVNVEEGLTEWQTPSLLVDKATGTKTEPRSASELKNLYDTIDASYQSVNPMGREEKGAPRFGETEQDLLERCVQTLTRLLEYSNGENIAIVSHAPCDQSMAYVLEQGGVSRKKESKVEPWAMGGITMFSRTKTSDWTMELYSDTQHMPGPYKAGLGKWSLPSLDHKTRIQ